MFLAFNYSGVGMLSLSSQSSFRSRHHKSVFIKHINKITKFHISFIRQITVSIFIALFTAFAGKLSLWLMRVIQAGNKNDIQNI